MLGAERSVALLRGWRILALRAGGLGDTILALPALAALRCAVGPSGSLELIGSEPYVSLASSAELASRVHGIDRAHFRALFDERADDREVRELLKRFDLVVAWSKIPLLSTKAVEMGVEVIEASPHPPEGVHASDHLYGALASLGIEGQAPPPTVPLTREGLERAEELLEREGLRAGHFIAIHPSSGSRRKNWPEARFEALAGILRADGVDWVWIEGEADRAVVQALAVRAPAPVVRLELHPLASLLAKSRGFVGNDSGVTHLAAAVGAPTVALFGPTDDRTWAPRGVVTVLDFGISPEALWAKALEAFRER
jgi:ADP-heptose:LPS heptosyltransferase